MHANQLEQPRPMVIRNTFRITGGVHSEILTFSRHGMSITYIIICALLTLFKTKKKTAIRIRAQRLTSFFQPSHGLCGVVRMKSEGHLTQMLPMHRG